MKMFEPIGYQVVVRPEKFKEKTSGGIILPPSNIDKEQQAARVGEVIAVGPLAFSGEAKGDVKIGDKVIHTRHSGLLVQDGNDNECRIIDDIDVRAVVR